MNSVVQFCNIHYLLFNKSILYIHLYWGYSLQLIFWDHFQTVQNAALKTLPVSSSCQAWHIVNIFICYIITISIFWTDFELQNVCTEFTGRSKVGASLSLSLSAAWLAVLLESWGGKPANFATAGAACPAWWYLTIFVVLCRIVLQSYSYFIGPLMQITFYIIGFSQYSWIMLEILKALLRQQKHFMGCCCCQRMHL